MFVVVQFMVVVLGFVCGRAQSAVRVVWIVAVCVCSRGGGFGMWVCACSCASSLLYLSATISSSTIRIIPLLSAAIIAIRLIKNCVGNDNFGKTLRQFLVRPRSNTKVFFKSFFSSNFFIIILLVHHDADEDDNNKDGTSWRSTTYTWKYHHRRNAHTRSPNNSLILVSILVSIVE